MEQAVATNIAEDEAVRVDEKTTPFNFEIEFLESTAVPNVEDSSTDASKPTTAPTSIDKDATAPTSNDNDATVPATKAGATDKATKEPGPTTKATKAPAPTTKAPAPNTKAPAPTTTIKDNKVTTKATKNIAEKTTIVPETDAPDKTVLSGKGSGAGNIEYSLTLLIVSAIFPLLKVLP